MDLITLNQLEFQLIDFTLNFFHILFKITINLYFVKTILKIIQRSLNVVFIQKFSINNTILNYL